MKSGGYDRLQHAEVTTVRINTDDDDAASFWTEDQMRAAEPAPMPVDYPRPSGDESVPPPQKPLPADPSDEPD